MKPEQWLLSKGFKTSLGVVYVFSIWKYTISVDSISKTIVYEEGNSRTNSGFTGFEELQKSIGELARRIYTAIDSEVRNTLAQLI